MPCQIKMVFAKVSPIDTDQTLTMPYFSAHGDFPLYTEQDTVVSVKLQEDGDCRLLP